MRECTWRRTITLQEREHAYKEIREKRRLFGGGGGGGEQFFKKGIEPARGEKETRRASREEVVESAKRGGEQEVALSDRRGNYPRRKELGGERRTGSHRRDR